MRQFFTILFLFSLYNYVVEAQQPPTFADPPGPEHVLVIYKAPSDDNDTLGQVSEAIKDYYQLKRGIPNSNIVRLDSLPDEWLTYGGTTHRIEIVQSGDIINDTTQASGDIFGSIRLSGIIL